MRIRNAAIAGATALAVAFGGTAVASAAEPNEAYYGSSTFDGDNGLAPLSSKIGEALDADQAADGTKIFGTEADVSSQPVWAQFVYGVGVTAAVLSALGLVIGPLANFIQFGPFSR
ncbi:hypothetical protein [uncultured Corynebacterium sp.]|uniref:hypothetical protein n=1 Tax=uncultured Corynebacterium sp. TaxID=159447 RepID=UPI0025F3869D|nr:hypothetical protein [uncultured Corynebacterium sp.]